MTSSRLPLVALIAGAFLLAGCAGGGDEPLPAGDASATVHVAPQGNDDGACTTAAPCRTISHALRRVAAGGRVQLGAGTYPDERLDVSPSDAGRRPVVLEPAPSAHPRLGVLEIATSGLELRHLDITGWHAIEGAQHLTFRDDHVRWFFADGVAHLRILGGQVGPADSVDPQIRAAGTAGQAVPRDILIEGVRFHDFTRRRDPEQHIECLQFGAGIGVVLRRNRFENCSEQALFINSWGGTAAVRDIKIVDNYFGEVPDGYYSLRIGTGATPGGTRDIDVSGNSAQVVMQVDSGIPGVRFTDNLAPREPWECFDDQQYKHNVWTNVRCSATDRQAPAAAIARAASATASGPPYGAAALPAR